MSEWWQEFFTSGSYTLLEDIPAERTQAQIEFILRELALEPGARLLDAACGIGRHSLPLSAHGLMVMGLDYTPAYLRHAVAGVARLTVNLPARFVRGDIRRLPLEPGTFQAVINLFTSFGYFDDDAEDQATLQEFARVLAPDGLLLLDVQNRDCIARHFLPTDWTPLSDGYLLESRRWDARSGRIVSDWTFLRNGVARTYTVTVRAYTCPEIERMLTIAGFEVMDLWGDWSGASLTLESRRIIVKARKRSV